MKILRFNESKKTKKEDLDGISTFDVKSLEPTKDDLVGFVSDYEEVKDKDIKKVKKEIEVTTPGLKKSIKKFEDFSITIGFGNDESGEEVIDPSNIMSDMNNDDKCCPNCDCDPCECSDEECCNGCSCNPCECEEEDGNVIPFGQFI